MITKTLARAIKNKKPAIIKEKGTPRYVVLDWDTYKKLQLNGAGLVSDRTSVGEFNPTRAQKQALIRAEANLSKRKTLSYLEVAMQDVVEDLQDHVRFEIAARESKGKKRYSLGEMKKRYGLK